MLYIWILDLLYRTLRKATEPDMLIEKLSDIEESPDIEELSELFIPLSVALLFPRRIKRVRKAVNAYLEKASAYCGEPVQISEYH